MNDIDIEELRRLSECVPPIPWRATEGDGWSRSPSYVIRSLNGEFVVEAFTFHGCAQRAAYIVAACNAVPELIAENRALQERAQMRQELVEQYEKDIAKLRQKVRELERQKGLMADGLELYCNYVHREDGECPFWIECPKGGLCTGEVTDEMWIEFFEREAAKGPGND